MEKSPQAFDCIKRVVTRLARDPQLVEMRMTKIEAMLIAQSMLLACRHPAHAAMQTHKQVRDLAESILRLITINDPDSEVFVASNLEDVP